MTTTVPPLDKTWWRAVKRQDTETMEKCLMSDPAVIGCEEVDNRCEFRGWTALHEAVAENWSSLVVWLIDHGADVNAVTTMGYTPLHWCEDTSVVETLLAHGANVHALDRTGSTPLHTLIMGSAQASQMLPMVNRLLLAGIDPDRPKHNGSTPLALCGHRGYKDFPVLRSVAERLLEAGADPDNIPLTKMASISDSEWHAQVEAFRHRRNERNELRKIESVLCHDAVASVGHVRL